MPGTHGPQHDTFLRQPSHGHDGSYYDTGFDANPGHSAGEHGALFDEFARRTRVDKHGERWDEFDWKPMPAKHGQLFDQDFAQPAALDGGDHGTWMDVFRGGTNLRYIYGGQDLEGVVIRCERDHVIVAPRHKHKDGGERHEVGLGQIKELRWATNTGAAREDRRPVAHPGDTPAPLTASDAHAPSAHDATASGRPLRALKSIAEDLGLLEVSDEAMIEKTLDAIAALEAENTDEVEKVRRGGGARGRVGSAVPTKAPIHAPSSEAARLIAVPHNKRDKAWHAAARAHLQATSAKFRAGEAAHREKTLPAVRHGGFRCTGCGHQSWRQHPVAAPGGGVHKHIAMKGCARCGTLHPYRIGKTAVDELDVTKDVDSTETATQGQDLETVGHRSGCPRGGSGPCGAEQDGKCTLCGAQVRDHEALGKSIDAAVIDLRKLAGLEA